MKKLIIIAAALLCGVCASARGYVGGSFAVGSYGGGSGTYFSILPEVGFTLSPKSTVAIEIGYQNKTYRAAETGVFKISPFYRYTITKLGEKVDLFVDGVIPMAFGDQYSQFGITVRPGLAFQASEKIALVAAVGALGFASINAGGTTTTAWSLGVNGGVNFGVYYKF